MQELHRVQVPRFLGDHDHVESGIKKQQLVVFTDASQEAYAFATYLRTVYNDGHVAVNMVASNFHVAPIRFSTIPRLELEGLSLGIDSIKIYNQVLKIPPEDIHVFTDSLTCLQWFRRQSRTMKVFVANRISRAQRKILLPNLHYVRSDSNPADFPTKGRTPEELIDSSLWFHGPDFLHSGEEIDFPELPNLSSKEEVELSRTVQEEMKTTDAHFVLSDSNGRIIFEDVVDGVKEIEHELDSRSADTWTDLLKLYLEKRDEGLAARCSGPS